MDKCSFFSALKKKPAGLTAGPHWIVYLYL